MASLPAGRRRDVRLWSPRRSFWHLVLGRRSSRGRGCCGRVLAAVEGRPRVDRPVRPGRPGRRLVPRPHRRPVRAPAGRDHAGRDDEQPGRHDQDRPQRGQLVRRAPPALPATGARAGPRRRRAGPARRGRRRRPVRPRPRRRVRPSTRRNHPRVASRPTAPASASTASGATAAAASVPLTASWTRAAVMPPAPAPAPAPDGVAVTVTQVAWATTSATAPPTTSAATAVTSPRRPESRASHQPPTGRNVPATATARRTAAALFRHSASSAAGSESATMPAPACT